MLLVPSNIGVIRAPLIPSGLLQMMKKNFEIQKLYQEREANLRM